MDFGKAFVTEGVSATYLAYVISYVLGTFRAANHNEVIGRNLAQSAFQDLGFNLIIGFLEQVVLNLPNKDFLVEIVELFILLARTSIVPFDERGSWLRSINVLSLLVKHLFVKFGHLCRKLLLQLLLGLFSLLLSFLELLLDLLVVF